MKIHIAIVSDQTLANLIPALMERPDKVYLVCSSEMSNRKLDRRLARLLRREAIAVEIRQGAPDVDLRKIHDFAWALAGEIGETHPHAEIVLNATGGTKLMAMGFVDMFRKGAVRIIYTDTAHRRIENLEAGDPLTAEPVAMTDVLDVPTYLAAQGFRFVEATSDDPLWRENVSRRKAVSKYLGKHSARLGAFIGAINWAANDALGNGAELVHPVQKLKRVEKTWTEVFGQMTNAGIIQWSEEHRKTIVFADSESARFVRGGWLEEYAWHIVNDAGMHDARMGVTGTWENTRKGSNEFDVLACNGNQLLHIECKTLRFHEENESEVAYKVDSLGNDVRGLFGETWLLSARQPTPVLSERAKQARIKLIDPGSLPKLKEHVQNWKGNDICDMLSNTGGRQ